MIISLLSFILIVTTTICLSSLFSVLMHELGHAIPLLFFSKGEVSIYIGSFGNSEKSVRFKIKRLLFFIKYNPLTWIKGLCIPPKENFSINRRVIYIACGPIVSILLTLISFYLINTKIYNGYFLFILYANLFFGFTFSYGSSFPRKMNNYTNEGKPLNNDATNIINLLKARKFPRQYFEAIELTANKEYAQASELLESLTPKQLSTPVMLRYVISVNLMAKNYTKANELSKIFLKNYKANADDYTNFGFLKNKSDDSEDAIKYYQLAIALNDKHIYALNNYGYTLSTILDKHEESVEYFDRAIVAADKFAFSYCNRGYAKIKMGKLDEGLADINYSLKLDDNNSYAYRNLGVYYLEKKDFIQAKSLFLKSRSLDEETYKIAYYLTVAENGLKTH